MIEIDWAGIARTRRSMGGEAAILLLNTDQPVTSAELDEAMPPDHGEGLANGGWFEGPKGWMLFIEGLPDEIRAWVGELSAALKRSGISGTLTGAGPTLSPAWARRHPTWTFSVAFGYHPDGHFPFRRWSCGQDLLDQTLRDSVAWVTRHHADIRVNLDFRAEFRVDPDTALKLMHQQLSTGQDGHCATYDPRLRHTRTGLVRDPNEVEFRLAADAIDWQAAVAECRDEMLNSPRQRLSIALLTSWTSPFKGGIGAQVPYVNFHAIQYYPELWGEFMVDPCGIQILTDKHLAKANDLTNWTTTRLDDHHHLVEARNLDAWYDHPFDPRTGADAELLDQARADFNDMILTIPQAERLGLNTKPPLRPDDTE